MTYQRKGHGFESCLIQNYPKDRITAIEMSGSIHVPNSVSTMNNETGEAKKTKKNLTTLLVVEFYVQKSFLFCQQYMAYILVIFFVETNKLQQRTYFPIKTGDEMCHNYLKCSLENLISLLDTVCIRDLE